MSQTSPLERHAESISAAAKSISAYCRLTGHPQPDFDSKTKSLAIPPDAPQHVHNARHIITSATTKIQQSVTEPCEYLQKLAIHSQYLSCIQWLCGFQVLACIPLEGSVLYSEIAEIAGVPEAQLRSVARMMMTSNFLYEPRLGELAHSTLSAHFVTDPALLDSAVFMTDVSMPAAAKLARATEIFGATEQRNQTALNVAFETEMPFYKFVAQSPKMEKQFAAYTKNVTTNEETNIKHLLTGFSWSALNEATVIDVGAYSYDASIALALAYPKLRFVVQGQHEILSASTSQLYQQSESVRTRITTQGHNVFTPQHVKGPDVYLLRMITYESPAAEACTILHNHLDVLRANPNARLVLVVSILPTPGSIDANEEALLRVRDLTWMQVSNGRERELSDFMELFAMAGDREGRLVLKNQTRPPGSAMSILEVVYQSRCGDGPDGRPTNGLIAREQQAF
ncbi:hypothetical protein LTR28_004735 [Elasticomyces elasticus]|nr:hypothetical protein LTR28_004735 [Elasticomyces elasticus]